MSQQPTKDFTDGWDEKQFALYQNLKDQHKDTTLYLTSPESNIGLIAILEPIYTTLVDHARIVAELDIIINTFTNHANTLTSEITSLQNSTEQFAINAVALKRGYLVIINQSIADAQTKKTTL